MAPDGNTVSIRSTNLLYYTILRVYFISDLKNTILNTHNVKNVLTFFITNLFVKIHTAYAGTLAHIHLCNMYNIVDCLL